MPPIFSRSRGCRYAPARFKSAPKINRLHLHRSGDRACGYMIDLYRICGGVMSS